MVYDDIVMPNSDKKTKRRLSGFNAAKVKKQFSIREQLQPKLSKIDPKKRISLQEHQFFKSLRHNDADDEPFLRLQNREAYIDSLLKDDEESKLPNSGEKEGGSKKTPPKDNQIQKSSACVNLSVENKEREQLYSQLVDSKC